jgi:hypothetical protein
MRAALLAVLVFVFSPFSFAMADPFTGNTLQASYMIITTLPDQSIRSAKGGVTLYFDNRGRVYDYNNNRDKTGALIGLKHWIRDPSSIQRIYFFGESLAIEDIEQGGKGGLIVVTKSDSGCSISVKFMNDVVAAKSEVETDYCRILPGHIDPIASE